MVAAIKQLGRGAANAAQWERQPPPRGAAAGRGRPRPQARPHGAASAGARPTPTDKPLKCRWHPKFETSSATADT